MLQNMYLTSYTCYKKPDGLDRCRKASMEMVIDRAQKYRQMVVRGKYQRLYTHLRSLPAQEWRATFGEIEAIIGFELPASARLHRPWWSNQSGSGGHSQALAWGIAGWETAEVDLEGETLLFRRLPAVADSTPTLDEVWPVHSAGSWPEGLSLRRQDIYGERA